VRPRVMLATGHSMARTPLEIEHQRLGHIGTDRLLELAREGVGTLRRFGERCIVQVPREIRKKADFTEMKGEPAVFRGQSEGISGWIVMMDKDGSITHSKDIRMTSHALSPTPPHREAEERHSSLLIQLVLVRSQTRPPHFHHHYSPPYQNLFLESACGGRWTSSKFGDKQRVQSSIPVTSSSFPCSQFGFIHLFDPPTTFSQSTATHSYQEHVEANPHRGDQDATSHPVASPNTILLSPSSPSPSPLSLSPSHPLKPVQRPLSPSLQCPSDSLHSPPDLPLQPIRFDLTSYLTNPRGDRSRGRRLRGDGASGQKGTHGPGGKREGRRGGAGAVGDDAHSAQ